MLILNDRQPKHRLPVDRLVLMYDYYAIARFKYDCVKNCQERERFIEYFVVFF